MLALAAATAQAESTSNLVSTVIRGSSVYSQAELFGVYSPELGKQITAESARAIAAALAEKYAADGYSRPAVRIDDRMVGVGVLAIDVVETRISTVEVVGNPGPYEIRLAELGRDLQDDSLLRSAELRSMVRRMRALPGLTLSTSTTRDADLPGAYRLNLETDFKPVSGTLRMSNRGTDEIGPNFLLGQVMVNGMLAGRTSAGLLFGAATDYDEYRGLGVTGNATLGPRGTRLAGSGFRSRSNPREAIVDRDDRYLRDRASLTAAILLGDDALRELSLTAGLRAEDLGIDRAGTRLRDERLRLLELGARSVRRGAETQYAAGIKLVQGLNGMGSGLEAVDLGADPRRADFTALVADYVRAASLGARWSWQLNALAQLSRHVLPYSERFKIGGDRLGRGFEVAEIAGDRGIGAKIELRRRMDGIPAKAGVVAFYSFYDLGAAWKNDRPGRESAATAGVGLAVSGQELTGRLELAKPLTHPDVEGREDLSVFVEITTSW
jgi:hemolysin activation/secretion protein